MSSNTLTQIPENWPNRNFSERFKVQPIHWHVQIHRHTNAQAKTILLLHGAGSSTHSWENLLPKLAERFTVIAPDLPGHGFTTGEHHHLKVEEIAKNLQNLLKELKIPNPDIYLGHSAGCNVALALALISTSQPQLIIGLNPALVKPPSVYNMFLGPLINPIATSAFTAHLLASTLKMSGAIDKILDSTNSHLTPMQRSRYRTLFSDSNHINGALSFVAAIDIPKLLRQLNQVKSHLTFVVTKQDSWIPMAAIGEVIHNYLPHAEVYHEEGGHLFHEANPQRALEIIRAAIAQVFFPLKDSV